MQIGKTATDAKPYFKASSRVLNNLPVREIKIIIFSNMGIEINIFKNATSKICKETLTKRLLKKALLKYFYSI